MSEREDEVTDPNVAVAVGVAADATLGDDPAGELVAMLLFDDAPAPMALTSDALFARLSTRF